MLKKKIVRRRVYCAIAFVLAVVFFVIFATTARVLKLELVPPHPRAFSRTEIPITMWQKVRINIELRTNPRNLQPAWYVYKGTVKLGGIFYGETEVDLYDPYGEYKENGTYRTGPTPLLKTILDEYIPDSYR
jgi:hypothetical protein